MLSVLLRFTDYDYLIRIFKLFIEVRLSPDSTVALKLKTNTVPHCRNIPKSNYKTGESGKIDTPKKSIDDRLFPWIDTDTSVEHSRIKKSLKIPKG